MEQNGVGTLHIQRYSGRNTTVALAFLDSNNNASYVFHKDYPQQRLPHPLPVPRQGDFVLFGSSFAITPSVRPALVHFLKSARHNGATVIYDPNFRKPRLSMDEVLPMIEENISFANIVRGSDEDFHNIFATSDLMDIYKEVSRCGCQVLVVTRGSKGASLVTERVSITVDSQNITPLSTIGAGDNFNAGLLYGLHELASTNTSIVNLSESQWKTLLDTGTRFACNVCLSLDNHVSRDFASSFKKH
jgi:fructokinase